MSDAALLRKPQPDDGFATRSEVEALRRRVHLLEQAVVQLSRRRPLADADRDWLTDLLPAIAAAAGDGVWALPDLAALALLPDNAGLVSALASHARRTGLRSLGKAFARCAGHAVNGLELRQVGACRAGALWQVVRV